MCSNYSISRLISWRVTYEYYITGGNENMCAVKVEITTSCATAMGIPRENNNTIEVTNCLFERDWLIQSKKIRKLYFFTQSSMLDVHADMLNSRIWNTVQY